MCRSSLEDFNIANQSPNVVLMQVLQKLFPKEIEGILEVSLTKKRGRKKISKRKKMRNTFLKRNYQSETSMKS